MEPKLPMGYTFEPSPQDLIFYLEHKAVGNPLPTNGFIEECDLYNIDPDELFRGWKNYKVRYFYVKPEKKVKGGSRFSRRFGNKATWKGNNKGSPAYNLKGMVLGWKKNFTYTLINDNGGKKNNQSHGGYIMDEYSLKSSIPNVEGYVLCCVKKGRQQKKDDHQDYHNLDDNDGVHSTASMILEVVDHHDNQNRDDFSEIDELLSKIDEESNLHENNPSTAVTNIEDCGNYECNTMATTGSYSDPDGRMDSYQDGIDFGIGDNNQDYQNPVMLNAEVDGSQKFPLHENPPTTLITSEDCDNIIDQDGSRDQFLLSNIDHPTPWMMIDAEVDGHTNLAAAVATATPTARIDDSILVLDHEQPFVDKSYNFTEEILSAMYHAKTGSEGLSLSKEFL
ncbi:hypothetical protein ACH5RR_035814 [Cinchona calisaya]|uniref:NAC domain-containing protein n=1 Tax=Cinchona calisaya TaxID=153742 RepID=A0ABD2Y3I5_9GENT